MTTTTTDTTTTTPHSYPSSYGLHLCAPNDRNGNPQRAYMVFADDGCHWLYEEGYIGSHAVPEHHRERIAGRWTRINITQAEYRRILRGI